TDETGARHRSRVRDARQAARCGSRSQSGSPLDLSANFAPAPQRGPQAAVEAEAIDRGGRGDRADAVEPDAGPLEAALLQDAARGRVAHARAGDQDVTAEVAEGMVDQCARRFGGIAVPPERDAEPIADLGLLAVATAD